VDTAATAALITSGTALTGSVLVWFASRRANKNTSEANVQKWADSLLVTLQKTQTEMEQVRREAHALGLVEVAGLLELQELALEPDDPPHPERDGGRQRAQQPQAG
jgi:hypothetical protein